MSFQLQLLFILFLCVEMLFGFCVPKDFWFSMIHLDARRMLRSSLGGLALERMISRIQKDHVIFSLSDFLDVCRC